MYYRFTSKTTPMSDYGHAMFVESRESVEYGYGENEWVYDGNEATNIESIKDIIINKWEESNSFGLIPYHLESLTGEEAYTFFNPDDIVMSAEAWDDGEALEWFCDNIAIPMDIKSVITNDGAIVFDSDLIKAA